MHDKCAGNCDATDTPHRLLTKLFVSSCQFDKNAKPVVPLFDWHSEELGTAVGGCKNVHLFAGRYIRVHACQLFSWIDL